MRRILQNIKTSFFGSIAGGSLIIEGLHNKNWGSVIAGIATAILGLMAKDSDTH